MAKFCRIIENKKGEQLLLFLKCSDEKEGKADLVQMFQLEDEAVVTVTIGCADWDKSEEIIQNYTQKKADEILNEPMDYIRELIGMDEEE